MLFRSSITENKKIVKIIREFLIIHCSISKLEKTLKSFVKKNNLNNSVFKDLSTVKNLSKINSKTIFSTKKCRGFRGKSFFTHKKIYLGFGVDIT